MITTLIFDWGGVLTIGRYTAAFIRVLEREYNKGLDAEYEVIDGSLCLMDLGKIDLKEFTSRMKQAGIDSDEEKMSKHLGDAVILNQEVIDLIERLKSNYRIILLSNNNQPVVDILKSNHKPLLELFDRTYFSYEIKAAKPDKAFFEHVINDADLNLDECIFIDDKEKNIKASEECGLKGILFENYEQFVKDLASFGISVG